MPPQEQRQRHLCHLRRLTLYYLTRRQKNDLSYSVHTAGRNLFALTYRTYSVDTERKRICVCERVYVEGVGVFNEEKKKDIGI